MNESELKTASLEDLRAEIERQDAVIDAAKVQTELCKQAIVDKIAEFSIGDRVTDANGDKWEIVGRKLWQFMKKDSVEYTGLRIKKDGTVGRAYAHIYREPIRLTPPE